MGLTSAMYTSLTGLNASQMSLDVSGNNISNANTPAYKSEDVLFETQLSRTLRGGSAGDGVTGGTNPVQVGLGVATAATSTDFTTGSIDSTGVPSDVAINGDGFFVLNTSNGQTVYSRAGEFQLDSSQVLTNSSGYTVMGYAVDSNFNLITNQLSNLTIPLGNLTVAEASTKTTFTDNLNSSDTSVIAGTAGSTTSEALVDQSTGAAATSTTLLTNLATADNAATKLFAAGNTLSLDAQKGDRSLLSTSTFTVTDTSTVGDYMNWLQSNMAIDTTISQTPAAGASITNGQITVTGNLGNDNVPTISVTSNGAVTSPMSWTTTTPDNAGTSTYTSFAAYDSLGNPLNVGVTMTLVGRDTNGNTTWQYIAESTDDSDTNKIVGSGTITYDTNGYYLSSTNDSITIDRAGTGANNVTLNLDFTGTTSMASASTLTGSSDGCKVGTLTKYNVAEDGTIVGSFSNGVDKTLGQIVLASFNNNEGLISVGDNCYTSGPNSGTAAVSTAGLNGTGTLTGGAIELSNVDITQEFIDMISASTMFSASGKVISTSQDMLQNLMSIMR